MDDTTSSVPLRFSVDGISTGPNSGYDVSRGVRDGDSYYSSNINGISSEQPTASAAPFYSQLDAVSASPHRGGPAKSNHTKQFGRLSTMQRLDMSAVAAALPDTGSPSFQYNNHHHHISSLGIRDFPSHSPLNATYPNGPLSPMGPQHMSQFRHPYSPIVAHSPRDGQPPQFNPTTYPISGSYQSFTPQSSVSTQVMPNSMPAQYVGSFPRPDIYSQMPLMQYPGSDARSFMPAQMINAAFMPSSVDSGRLSKVMFCTFFF
ncbi:hypothetical protein BDV97DRAFT_91877 [Delphinella strobiligena]|nr:hypothetical protein BDV97DRAFT_91877 [Delphinella strobiligena]